jgi:hypothetical protein
MNEQLIHRIKVRQSELQVAMGAGNPATWDAYQRMVGEMQGLQLVLHMIEMILYEKNNKD